MSESVMRGERPFLAEPPAPAGDGSGGDAGLGGEVGGPLPGLQPRDELHLPVEGQVYGLLAGRRGDAPPPSPNLQRPCGCSRQLGRLGQAEPRRDGLHGELPGLQRVHADSNPDTGVSNFLSAPPPQLAKIQYELRPAEMAHVKKCTFRVPSEIEGTCE